MKKIVLTLLTLFPILLLGQVGIYFTFGNGQITEDGGQLYYEFDVLVNGSSGTTKFGELMALVYYNTGAFGTWVNDSGNATISKGVLLEGNDFYELRYNDNQANKIAVGCEFMLTNQNYALYLPATPVSIFHLKFKIQDSSQQVGLSFDEATMEGEQFYADHWTMYNPTVADDTLDETLPVELSSFTAAMNNSFTGVNLTWVTQSETNLVGYGIYRGETSELSEAIDLNAFIGATNTSQTQVYVYTDGDAMPEQTYWYWLESKEMNGINGFHGPICFSVPQQPAQTPQVPVTTGLVTLYPNPFNPDLSIRYALEQSAPVNLVVTNIKGQTVRQLVNETKAAGTHSFRWDGKDEWGQPCASGLYLVRMLCGNKTSSRKVMLMK